MTETRPTVSAAGDEWAALRALAEKATAGPWEMASGGTYKDGRYQIDEYFVRRPDDDVSIAAAVLDPETSNPSVANAAYIAAANPAAIGRLLTAHAALVAERDALAARAADAENVGRMMLKALFQVDGRLLTERYVEPVQWAELVVSELATANARATAAEADAAAERQRAERAEKLLRDAKYVIETTARGLGLSVDGRTISTTVLLAQIDAALKGDAP